MKNLNVNTLDYQRGAQVRLSGIANDAPLTPQMARNAVETAFGVRASAIVTDCLTTYKVYRGNTVRKVNEE